MAQPSREINQLKGGNMMPRKKTEPKEKIKVAQKAIPETLSEAVQTAEELKSRHR